MAETPEERRARWRSVGAVGQTGTEVTASGSGGDTTQYRDAKGQQHAHHKINPLIMGESRGSVPDDS